MCDLLASLHLYLLSFDAIQAKTTLRKGYQRKKLTAVFSPGRGLVGFPQEKLKWRI